jgi:antimicrobial peptide system SdpB family protein
MTTTGLDRIGRWARSWAALSPATNVYGVARTLLALATASTLLANPARVLFTPAAGLAPGPRCGPWTGPPSLFCLAPASSADVLRWVCVGVLLVVASGWRPRWTALAHAWVSYSFFSSATLFDGGDQITVVLTVLLLPVALADPRRWHWSPAPGGPLSSALRLTAWSCLLAIRVQVAAVYLVAGIAKLAQPEWANGTAIYYWLQSYGGAPSGVMSVVALPPVVVAMTWGPIALEVALAAALLLSGRARAVLLVLAITFHAFIALFFNLASFATAMTAALILFLRPAYQPFALPAGLQRLGSARRLLSPMRRIA